MTPSEEARRVWLEAKQQHDAARDRYTKARNSLIRAYLAEKYPDYPLVVISDGYYYKIQCSGFYSRVSGSFDLSAINQEVTEYLLREETIEI